MIDEAIAQINELNPEVGESYFNKQILEIREDLHFELQKVKLIGMIKNKDLEQALLFAQEKLAPKAESNVLFLLNRRLNYFRK